MPTHINIPTKYWELTSECPLPPVERNEKSWLVGNPADPIWDIDALPITYTDSRWSAFIVKVPEVVRKNLCPNPPLTVWDGENADLVEVWYVDHKNTMLGPHFGFGVTISATYKDPRGNIWKAAYYPYMYFNGDATADAYSVFGFPRRTAFIRCTVHGGTRDTDFFSFAISRNGYLIHTTTGRFDDRPVVWPVFYGRTDWGKFNMKVVTRPDVSSSEWQLTYLLSELPPAFGRYKHRFIVKPEHTRTASKDAINWFMQGTPFDNMGTELKITEVTGLISFVCDIILIFPRILWIETYDRSARSGRHGTEENYKANQSYESTFIQGGMNIQDLAKEAELFHDSISLLTTLSGKPLEDFSNLLIWDIATIAMICGHADGNFDSDEKLAGLFFVLAIASNGVQTCYNWNGLPINVKENCKQNIYPIFEEVKKRGFNKLSIPEQLKDSNDVSLFDNIASTLYRAAQVIVKADGKVTKEEEEALKKVYDLIYKQPLKGMETSKPDESTAALNIDRSVQQGTLKEVLDELNGLTGMGNIKQEVLTLTNFLKVQKERMERGMLKTPISLHTVFCGPPGTGKTTVARLIGKIYKNLGFLSKGHLIETDRSGLVAGYVGQTSLKVDEVVNSALDGVLFIDEAYALKVEHSPNDFGQEVIDILLKRMEDYRDRLVVIAAGYPDEMQKFIESNPGLKSRFNRYFFFDHYKPEELLAIFEKFCRDGHFKLTSGARDKLLNTFDVLHTNRERTFGNGRLARNIFEKVIERQANRIVSIAPLTDEILTTIIEEDIPLASQFSS